MTSGVTASDRLTVATIHTLPVEQRWISRTHGALLAAADRGDIVYAFSENAANTDHERVMREYAEAGQQPVLGEVFAPERAARKVSGDDPDAAFLMGSSFDTSGDNPAVFDNWIHEPGCPTGMIAGAATNPNVIGMVGGYEIPGVNRPMNACRGTC